MARRIALIMAGGGGARLWPASTPARPKPLIPGLPELGSTLLSASVARLEPLVAREDVYVVTSEDQVESVRAALPFLSSIQIIAEPCGRNTAPAVALSVIRLRAALGVRADETTLIVLPADHFVADPGGFRDHLAAACAHAEAADTIATLGITPVRADTGYGYMERESSPRDGVHGDKNIPAYAALRFVEKPDLETARRYQASGNFVWNAGIFAMPIPRIERDLARLCPDMWNALRTGATQQVYEHLIAVPIDVAVMEKLQDIVVIPANIGWSDLGTWESIAGALAPDAAGNVIRTGDGARTEMLETSDCLIWNEDATVGVLGVSGLAVVVCEGRVLVCSLDQAQRMRALVDRLS